MLILKPGPEIRLRHHPPLLGFVALLAFLPAIPLRVVRRAKPGPAHRALPIPKTHRFTHTDGSERAR